MPWSVGTLQAQRLEFCRFVESDEVVPEFVEVEVAVLRPEPACGRLGLSAKTMKEDRG
jgi:hypothetical protein